MPSKERDVDVDAADDRPREKHRRSKSERKADREKDKDRDKDRDKDKDKDRHREKHRSSRSTLSRLSEAGSETSSTRRHRSSRKGRDHRDRKDEDRIKKSRSTSASELFGGVSTTSLDMPRISLPYPSFSKAHSKEAVVSREDVSSSRRSSIPFTPDTTDIGGGTGGEDERKKERSKSADLTAEPSASKKSSRPPTPPDTDLSADKKREGELKVEEEPPRPKSRASGISRAASLRDEKSRVSDKSRSSSQATFVKAFTKKSHDLQRSDSRASSSSRRSAKRSSKRDSKDPESLEADSSPSTPQDLSPQTPTQSAQFSPHVYGGPRPEPSATPDIDEDDIDVPSKTATPASGMGVPPPPPPPPPPAVDIQDLPRVDYLLQNGGLAYPVPKTFLSVLPRQNGTRPSNPPLAGADTLFAPFFNLLDQYSTVLNKHGSIAVATGHRSIARRLLNRLENVFSRDLPPHGCSCVMCETQGHEIHRGLTWGDVLEWASGRIELPEWPPFDLAEIGNKAAEVSAEVPQRPASPVKMDPDIDEQFREHYLRQSKKVRSAVDKWLNKTAETPIPPPQDVDDETLAFAILTSLDLEDRPFFNALLAGSREVRPATRAPTPAKHLRNDFIIKTGLSLQRLYRLQQTPRDAESVMYLIKNPHTHDLLVTLSNINNSEWEILTSGRFDGFLWSGADADGSSPIFDSRGPTPAGRSTMTPGSRPQSAMSSRITTPFSPYSRGATPASHISLASSSTPGGRQPVSNDEEMEMAVIAEIEREIYSGMERLEDAFEKLHHQAEMVRNSLRQRGAGLMQNLQNRRRIDVLPVNAQTPGPDRPFSVAGSDFDGGSDSEWGMDDVELMPDDSASNISSSRHRRPKRRTERRTPAPIEEDEEEY
ncbi:hypothetical protein ACO1O0_005621 [Amphichorda felina]